MVDFLWQLGGSSQFLSVLHCPQSIDGTKALLTERPFSAPPPLPFLPPGTDVRQECQVHGIRLQLRVARRSLHERHPADAFTLEPLGESTEVPGLDVLRVNRRGLSAPMVEVRSAPK
jgi:hypothetical protein